MELLFLCIKVFLLRMLYVSLSTLNNIIIFKGKRNFSYIV